MRILILVFILLVSTRGLSQKQFLGFKVGPGFTDVGGDLFKETANRIGLNIGLMYDYSLSDNLSLGAELMYNQRGFRDDFFASSTSGRAETTEFNYDYIAIPIKVSYQGNSKFYGFNSIGVIPAFLINAKTKIPAISGSEPRTEDVKNKVAPVDIAGMLEVGAGYKFTDRYKIFISLSAQVSFFKFSNDEYFADEIMRHYGFTFAMGARYRLGK